ncbi:MAG: hypothetical protein ACOCWH_07220 [Spirochaetota bacterium]
MPLSMACRVSLLLVFFLALFSISCTGPAVHEEVRGGRITVYVVADSAIETDGMDMDALEEYMVGKAAQRASSLLTAQYMAHHGIRNFGGPPDMSSCLKNVAIHDLYETNELVECTVTFTLDNCQTILQQSVSKDNDRQEPDGSPAH